MLQEIIAKLYKTIISAYPTPSKKKIHIGNLRGLLIQDFLSRVSNLAGYDTFFPFGMHPTGFPSFSHVEAVLADLAYGTSDSEAFHWEAADLDKLVETLPHIQDIAADYANSEGTEQAGFVHEAALDFVHYVGMGLIGYLDMYNVDTSQFDETFLTTITPWYQRFTEWWIDSLFEKGFIDFVQAEMGYCSLCDSTKEITSDMDEVLAANIDHIKVVGPKGDRKFKGPVNCKVTGHRNHQLEVVLSEGWKIIYNAQLENGQTLADLTSSLVRQNGTLILPHTYKNSIHSLFASRKPKNVQRDYTAALGTPSRFSDPDFPLVIGPLMDSNGYFFMYVIAQAIHEGRLPADKIEGEFFDYMLRTDDQLRELDINPLNLRRRLQTKTSVHTSTLREIKQELHTRFGDWINIMGWDHSEAHALFSNMQIAALDLGHLMQTALLAYGTVQDTQGRKMGKTFGNAVSIDELLELAENGGARRLASQGLSITKSSADIARLYLLGKENPTQNLKFDQRHLKNFGERVAWVYDLFVELGPTGRGRPPVEDDIDKWLMSRVMVRMEKSLEFVADLRLHKAYEELFFDEGSILEDIQQYHSMKERSGEKVNRNIVKRYWQAFAQLASPFIPYVASVIGEQVGLNMDKDFKSGTLITDYERDPELEIIMTLSQGYKSKDLMKMSGDNWNKIYPLWENYGGDIGAEMLRTIPRAVFGEQKNLDHVNVYVSKKILKEILEQGVRLVNINDYFRLTGSGKLVRRLRNHFRDRYDQIPCVYVVPVEKEDKPMLDEATFQVQPVYTN